MSEETINKIGKYFEDKPVIRAYLFGSHARGEQSFESDIDILVGLRPFYTRWFKIFYNAGRVGRIITNQSCFSFLIWYIKIR